MRISIALVCIALLPALPSLTTAADRPNGKPNVILCMADDQGWGDMAYNGHPVLKTPTFDELAKTGLRFDRFYAAAPVCSPTRASVMTGRHPNRMSCFSWGHTLRPQEITVGEALKTAGYTTGHFGKWHLGSVRADSPVCPGRSGFDEWFSSPNFFDNDPVMSHNGRAVETKGESSHVTVEAALTWIAKVARGDKPFLAVVWFGNPHAPHVPVPEFEKLYADQPPKQRNFLAEVTAMDHAMGELRRGLRAQSIADNTLLWYCSDNGAIKEGSTGGLSGGKGNLFEGGLLVPALIEWPARVRKPRVSATACNTCDIYPTLLEIAGVNMPNQPPLDGVSLLGLIEGKSDRPARPMGFWVYPTGGIGTPSAKLMAEQLAEEGGQAPATKAPDLDAGEIKKRYPESELPGSAAWIDGDWKLLRTTAKKGNTVSYSLFNLTTDREEKKNLIEQEPARAKKMQAALEVWQKSVVRSLNGEDYAAK